MLRFVQNAYGQLLKCNWKLNFERLQNLSSQSIKSLANGNIHSHVPQNGNELTVRQGYISSYGIAKSMT